MKNFYLKNFYLNKIFIWKIVIWKICIWKIGTGAIHLHGYRVQSTGTASSGERRKYAFELLPPEPRMRHFHFYTDSENDRKRWSTLSTLIELKLNFIVKQVDSSAGVLDRPLDPSRLNWKISTNGGAQIKSKFLAPSLSSLSFWSPHLHKHDARKVNFNLFKFLLDMKRIEMI